MNQAKLKDILRDGNRIFGIFVHLFSQKKLLNYQPHYPSLAILPLKLDQEVSLKEIKNMYLVRLHPNNKNNTYEKIEVPNLQSEINDLMELRKNNLLNELRS